MVEWQDDLTVGVEFIDDEHKELINKINELMIASQSGRGLNEIFNIINFLEKYISTHFKNEEDLMLNEKYSKYEEHKRMHDYFIKDFLSIKKDIETNGARVNSLVRTNKSLLNWLINHINKMDKELGNFIKLKRLIKGGR